MKPDVKDIRLTHEILQDWIDKFLVVGFWVETNPPRNSNLSKSFKVTYGPKFSQGELIQASPTKQT